MNVALRAAGKGRGRRRAIAGVLGCVLISHAVPAEPRAETDPRPEVGAGAAVADVPDGWTSFRGPDGNGHAAHANPPLSWGAEQGATLLWKTPVPTHGMSSPIVWGKRLFLTGADDSSRQIYCFDTDSGELVWRHDVDGLPGFPADSELPTVLDETGFAAPTPTTDGRYVAAVFATGELVAVNMRGERVWGRHLGVPRNRYGHASSLISHEGLLFVQYDQAEGSKLLAFDLASGDPVWEVERDAISWSSPLVVDNKGRTELILTNSAAVDSYDPTSGRQLWRLECLGGEVASSAAYADGILFVASTGATGSAIDIGSHDVEPTILWQWDEALPEAVSPLAKEGYLIVPTEFGVVSCLEAKTGKLLWEKEFDRGFWSSPIAVDDRVYMIDRSGYLQVFKLGDEFKLLGVSETGESVYATPAIIRHRIYIRGLTHLLCIAAKTN